MDVNYSLSLICGMEQNQKREANFPFPSRTINKINRVSDSKLMVEPNTNISSSQTSYFDMPTAPAAASSSSEGESELDDGSDTVTMILSSRRRRRTARRRRRNRRNILYTHPNYQKGECLHDRGYKQKMLKSETGVVINRREHHHNSGCCCI